LLGADIWRNLSQRPFGAVRNRLDSLLKRNAVGRHLVKRALSGPSPRGARTAALGRDESNPVERLAQPYRFQLTTVVGFPSLWVMECMQISSREMKPNQLLSSLAQPIQIAHQSPLLRKLNSAEVAASSGLMGVDRR
jgi:hypothetical protein